MSVLCRKSGLKGICDLLCGPLWGLAKALWEIAKWAGKEARRNGGILIGGLLNELGELINGDEDIDDLLGGDEGTDGEVLDEPSTETQTEGEGGGNNDDDPPPTSVGLCDGDDPVDGDKTLYRNGDGFELESLTSQAAAAGANPKFGHGFSTFDRVAEW